MGRHAGDNGLTRAQVLQAEVRRRQADSTPYRPSWRAVLGLGVVLLGITLPAWLYVMGAATGRL